MPCVHQFPETSMNTDQDIEGLKRQPDAWKKKINDLELY
jgi:hypothetical protein